MVWEGVGGASDYRKRRKLHCGCKGALKIWAGHGGSKSSDHPHITLLSHMGYQPSTRIRSPQEYPPSWCQTEQENIHPTPTTYIALSQVTHDSSTNTPVFSLSDKKRRSLFSVSAKENKGQSLHKQPILQTQLLIQRSPQTPSKGFCLLPQLV